MLYIYFEIRYYNQLMKIVPAIIEGLFAEVEKTVRGNGGRILRYEHPAVFCFNTTEIGATLGATRTLDFILRLSDKNKKRISDYLILCGMSDVADFDYESFFKNKSWKITAINGCFCYSNTYPLLSPYIKCTRSEEYSDLFQCGEFLNPIVQAPKSVGNNFVISEKALSKVFETAGSGHLQQYILEHGAYSYSIPENSQIMLIHVYPSPNSGELRCLREMLEYLPLTLEDLASYLPDDRQKLFVSECSCIAEYDAIRFEYQNDPVQKQVFSSFFLHFFEALDCYALSTGRKTAIFVHSSQYLDSISLDFLTMLFADNCRFTAVYLFFMRDQELDPDGISEYRSVLLSRISALPTDLRNIFYLIVKASQYLFYHEIRAFFEYLGKESSYLDAVCGVFAGYGLLENSDDIRSVVKDIRISGLQCDVSTIESTVAGCLYALFRQKKLRAGIELFKILLTLGDVPDSNFAENAILKTYDRHAIAVRELQLSREYLIRCGVPENTANRECQIFEGFIALNKGDIARASTLFGDVDYVLGVAICNFAAGAYPSSFAYAKRALQSYQDAHDVAGESRALQLIGSLSFINKKFSDAEDYMTYALHGDDLFIDGVRRLSIFKDLLAVLFMAGKYSSALRTCVMAEETAMAMQDISSAVELIFIRGRCQQICGYYTESTATFESGAILAERFGLAEAAVLCRLWKDRNLLYTGFVREAVSSFTAVAEQAADAVVFLVEAAAITGSNLPPRHLIEGAAALFQSDGSMWQSGFSFLENRVFTGDELIPVRLLHVFYMYCTSSVPELRMESLASIHRIIRESENVNYDPYVAIYYYLYYYAMPDAVDAKSIDKVTILGRAFKCLQVISSGIDETIMARNYMSDSYWNKRIMEQAHAYMLF